MEEKPAPESALTEPPGIPPTRLSAEALFAFARRTLSRILWLVWPRVPLFVARPWVGHKVRRALADPRQMADARDHMEHLLGAIGRSAEVDEASRAYVTHWVWCDQLRWHPRAITHQRVVGSQHLRAAHERNKGVVLSFVHHAHFDGAMASVARDGIAVHVLAAEFQAPGPNYIQHSRVFGSGGGLISPKVGTAGLIEELRRGRVVAAAIDVPGGSAATFAGRQVRCSSGAAHAAVAADAPVVVLTSHRDEDGVYIRLSEPLEPGDFDDAGALLEELVRQHESALLQWPEVAYIPKVCWTPVDQGS